MPDYVAGLSWELIKQKLETETDYRIKPYDDDLDGVLDWKALRFPGIRQSVLAEFTDPKILIVTSSMLDVYNSADKVEHTAGNISADSKELTIVGGSDTEAGNSWVYWNLPEDATKVYVKVKMTCNSGSGEALVDLCDANGGTLSNPPDFYELLMQQMPTETTAGWFRLNKVVGGSRSELANEDITVLTGTFVTAEIFCDIDTVKVWRDNELKFNVAGDNANIPSIKSVRLRCNDKDTAEARSAIFKGMVIIVYE